MNSLLREQALQIWYDHRISYIFVIRAKDRSLIRSIELVGIGNSSKMMLLSPCARFAFIAREKESLIIDFTIAQAKKINSGHKTIFWSRYQEKMIMGILDHINDRVWLYHGLNLVAEIAAHGQISATDAEIRDDMYLLLKNSSQQQVFRLASINISKVIRKYTEDFYHETRMNDTHLTKAISSESFVEFQAATLISCSNLP